MNKLIYILTHRYKIFANKVNIGFSQIVADSFKKTAEEKLEVARKLYAEVEEMKKSEDHTKVHRDNIKAKEKEIDTVNDEIDQYVNTRNVIEGQIATHTKEVEVFEKKIKYAKDNF